MKDKPQERQLSLRFEESTFEAVPHSVSAAPVQYPQAPQPAQVFDLASHRAAVAAQANSEEARRAHSLLQRAIDSVRFF